MVKIHDWYMGEDALLVHVGRYMTGIWVKIQDWYMGEDTGQVHG